MHSDLAFPALLAKLHALSFDDGDEIDFEPFPAFCSPSETRDWIRAWAVDPALSRSEFRIFGQDHSGGFAAFWLIRDGAIVLDQPIVFFGSEGEVGVVARNFNDYLWLLACGVGPFEAISYRGAGQISHPAFLAFASEHAVGPARTAAQIIADASTEFPKFGAEFR